MARTQQVWSKKYGYAISREEALEILRTLGHLVEVLYGMARTQGAGSDRLEKEAS